MNTVTTIIILIFAAAFSSAIMIITHRTEKRGCGRGCATCPNRSMCHRKRKKTTKQN